MLSFPIAWSTSAPTKPQVFREVLRVLKPGGRLAISDIVTDGELPTALKKDLEAWAGCISGALDVNDLKEMLKSTGFVNIQVEPKYFDDAALSDLGVGKEHYEKYDVKSLKRTIFQREYLCSKTIKLLLISNPDKVLFQLCQGFYIS